MSCAVFQGRYPSAGTRRTRGADGYGFDVRSLQELMAAMHLTTASPPPVEARLRLAAANPHWRNAWIFAAGRLFSTYQPDQQEASLRQRGAVHNKAESGSACVIGKAVVTEDEDRDFESTLRRPGCRRPGAARSARERR